jgi:hypothetical protein
MFTNDPIIKVNPVVRMDETLKQLINKRSLQNNTDEASL